jgi:hypothetical protein
MPVAPSVQSARRASGPVAVDSDDVYVTKGIRISHAMHLHGRQWVMSLASVRPIRGRSAVADLAITWETMALVANTPLAVSVAVFTSGPFAFPPPPSPARSIMFWEWVPTNRCRGLKQSGLSHRWQTSSGLPIRTRVRRRGHGVGGTGGSPSRSRPGQPRPPLRRAPDGRQLESEGLSPASIVP